MRANLRMSFKQQIWLFQCSKMTSSGHFCPMLYVVNSFCIRAWRPVQHFCSGTQHILWEPLRACPSGDRYSPTFFTPAVIDPRCGIKCTRGDIDHNVGEQFIFRKCAFNATRLAHRTSHETSQSAKQQFQRDCPSWHNLAFVDVWPAGCDTHLCIICFWSNCSDQAISWGVCGPLGCRMVRTLI